MRKSRPLKDNDVYKALGSLGRVDKSLAPGGIEKYEALLNCSAVERRVSRSATKRERAEAVRDVILKAVNDEFPEESDSRRKVAEAALCTRDEFVGQSVAKREEKLSKEGVTKEQYGKLRPDVVEQVADNLTRDNSPNEAALARIPKRHEKERYLSYSLDHLGQDALALNFAGRAALLVPELDGKTFIHGDIHFCAQYLFDAYIKFVSTSRFAFWAYPELLADWQRQHEAIDADSLAQLTRHVQDMAKHCGLFDDVDDPDFSPPHLLGFNQETVHITDLYHLAWLPRFLEDWPFSSPTSIVRQITATATAVHSLLIPVAGHGWGREEEHVSDAYAFIRRYFISDETEPTIEGQRLYDYVKAAYGETGLEKLLS